MNDLDLGKVPFSKVKRMLESVECHFNDTPERLDDTDLTFEFIIGSLFPSAWQNMQDAIKDAYTQGYINGLNYIAGDTDEA